MVNNLTVPFVHADSIFYFLLRIFFYAPIYTRPAEKKHRERGREKELNRRGNGAKDGIEGATVVREMQEEDPQISFRN